MRLSKKNLSLLGTGIYLCEGAKMRISRGRPHYAIEFTNKNPQLIRTFLKFLREIILAEEDRIKAELFIYPDHNERYLLFFGLKIQIFLSQGFIRQSN